jgi:hypothetical protein
MPQRTSICSSTPVENINASTKMLQEQETAASQVSCFISGIHVHANFDGAAAAS